ncbi:DUF4270 domain-containing protein [Flavobacterium psychrotrophum]|uniref:DUF4270 domain-containing protein n=1 Tax=Flavobacterium psychrotrophum TaxID=2294119 RepID=UPI000E324CDB|nr:DUF4270 domain-containing protein [Flavobacterium psychrotrophum]
MNKFSFVKVFLFAMVAVIFAVSCDDEYGQLGSDIVGGDIHNTSHRLNGKLVAYDRPTGAVQTSGMDVNLLGSYDHPVFGKTTASYVTQVQMATVPTFTGNVVIDSAWIYVPYYSKLENTSTVSNETVNTYSLDSIYGDTLAPYRLQLRKNNFYLRTTDASSGGSTSQYYYSDQSAILDNQGESLLEGGEPSKPVTFSNTEILRTVSYTDADNKTSTITAERLAPGLFMYLNKDFFVRNFVNAPSGTLMNNNALAEYFRGISFTAQQEGSRNVIGSPKFTDGYIKVKYTQDVYKNSKPDKDTIDGVPVTKRQSLLLTLNLKGNHVNVLKNEPNNTSTAYFTAISNSNTTEGDEKLYLKGGEGSIALLDILSDDDVNTLKADSILINEARIKVYVDEATMGSAPKPLKIYLYDVNNKRPVYDYSLDQTSSTTPKFNKLIYGGHLLKDSDGQHYYNIRITNHINNIVSKDSTNVKLGLVVSRDITVTANAALKTPFSENSVGGKTVPVKFIPAASVTHPFGVVLYGTNPAVPETKRAKLEIFYTKPLRN